MPHIYKDDRDRLVNLNVLYLVSGSNEVWASKAALLTTWGCIGIRQNVRFICRNQGITPSPLISVGVNISATAFVDKIAAKLAAREFRFQPAFAYAA